jgi:hypothetical protein
MDASAMAARRPPGILGAGASSMSFWCLRWGRAFPITESVDAIVGIGQDLDLDVTRPIEIALGHRIQLSPNEA